MISTIISYERNHPNNLNRNHRPYSHPHHIIDNTLSCRFRYHDGPQNYLVFILCHQNYFDRFLRETQAINT